MTVAIGYVLVLLVLALALFIWDYFSVDVVGLVILVLLAVPGVVPPREALASFGDPTIIVLISLFVLTTGVVRTGVVERLGLKLAALGGKNPNRLIRITLPIVTALGVGLSNTERTAAFLPVVVGLARKAAIPLSRVLMLLAFAALLGGGLTVISTSTNLLVSSQLPRYGLSPIAFFEPTPVGACIAVIGLAYVLFIAPKLLPNRSDEDLADRYDLRRYLSEAVVTPRSRLAGKTLEESRLGASMNLTVAAIVREDNTRLVAPRPHVELREGDVLIVEGKAEDILSVKDTEGIEIHPERKLSAPDLESEDVRMMEAMVLPSSDLVGRTLAESAFRERTGVTVLAIHSAGGADRVVKIAQRRLRASDVLLLQGRSGDLERLRQTADLLLLEDVSAHHPRSRRGRIAATILAGSILVGATGILPLAVAFLLGGLLLVVTRCITSQEAYESVPWRLIVMIGCMITFGVAMERTGAARFLADLLVPALRPFGPYAVLAGFFLLTVFLTQPMSNQAAALVVLPVAVTVARQIGMNPRSLVMGVTFAASCSFLTPLEPSCLLVYGPGRYRFFDFTKVGAPLTVLVFVVSMALIPVFWPFHGHAETGPAPPPPAPPREASARSERPADSEESSETVPLPGGDRETAARGFPLLASGVRVPAPGESGREAAGAREVAGFGEAENHRRDLADLDVLDAQIATEPLERALFSRGDEARSRRSREEELLLDAGVLPQRRVERRGGAARPLPVGVREGGEDRSEERVEPAVRGGEKVRQGRGVAAHREAANFRVPIARPSAGSRTFASRSPASNP